MTCADSISALSFNAYLNLGDAVLLVFKIAYMVNLPRYTGICEALAFDVFHNLAVNFPNFVPRTIVEGHHSLVFGQHDALIPFGAGNWVEQRKGELKRDGPVGCAVG